MLMHRSGRLTVSNMWQRLELSLRFDKMHWGEVLIKYLLLLLQDHIREARARNGKKIQKLTSIFDKTKYFSLTEELS